MIWKIPRMWEDGECWIIGGGPSMPHQFGIPEDVISAVTSKKEPLSIFSPYLSPIHGKHIIAVNAAFGLGRWIDIMFYGDGGLYWKNKDALLKFPNVKVTCNANTMPNRPGVYNVKYVHRDLSRPFGISTRANMVSWNKHSGGAAINLAYHLGVKTIYLLGFDMNLATNGAQHWHAEYANGGEPKRAKHLPFKKHMESFTPIENDAKRLKLKIYNVNLESAIPNFPKITLEEALKQK